MKTPKRGRVDVDEVWRENGDHCSFCGKSRKLCERLEIGLTAQHVLPFRISGDDGPLIPYCARCQQATTAALEETRRIERGFETLDEQLRRIGEKFFSDTTNPSTGGE